MTGNLFKGGNLDTDVSTGRTRCETESRDRNDVSVSQGTPKMASKSPEPREKA